MQKLPTPVQLNARDIRVDQIGFARELNKHFSTKLAAAVKTRMSERKLKTTEGDYFTGLLVTGNTTSTADPDKLLRMYESKKIKRADFLAAITVSNKSARDFLSEQELAAISCIEPASDRLDVDRIKGVEMKLVDALAGLGAALKNE